MSDQDTYDKFVDMLLDAVNGCLDKGTAARMSLGGEHNVTIDIYESKTQMRVFDETILKTAAQSRGMSVVSNEVEKVK